MSKGAMMKTVLRASLVKTAFAAIAKGIRVPQSKMARSFNQWACLIDLIEELGVNVFLDVGANRGFFGKHLRMAGYKGRLISFEPILLECERIRAMARNDPAWTICAYALGSEDTTKEFHINECGDQTVYSSFLTLKERSIVSRVAMTKMCRLDDVLPSLLEGIECPRIFLKMDTQGYDKQVIEGARAYLANIVGLQSEIAVIPLYEEMSRYTESLAHYERLGFALVDLFVVNRRGGLVLEYDSVMARPAALRNVKTEAIVD